MKPILLFRLGGLGDLLVAFPSIFFLRKEFPTCDLTLVCREEYGQIFKETGIIDRIESFRQSKFSFLYSESASSDSKFLDWLKSFSLILGWMQKKSSINRRMSCFSGLKENCHFFIYNPNVSVPINQFFFEKTVKFIRGNGLSIPDFKEYVYLPLSSKQKQEGLNFFYDERLSPEEKIIVVHPGSGSKTKCWPLKNFLEIIRLLGRKGLRGILVTGRAEERLEKDIQDYLFPPGWEWHRSPPLTKLAGLLSRASFYLGNDSGVTHLAASCGTFGIALFSEDLKIHWRPGGHISTLLGKSLAQISVKTVWKSISSFFE